MYMAAPYQAGMGQVRSKDARRISESTGRTRGCPHAHSQPAHTHTHTDPTHPQGHINKCLVGVQLALRMGHAKQVLVRMLRWVSMRRTAAGGGRRSFCGG